MNRFSVCLQTKYNHFTQCYICRPERVKSEANNFKVQKLRLHYGLVYQRFRPPVQSKALILLQDCSIFSHIPCGNNAHMIVYIFGIRFYCKIKLVNQNIQKYLQIKCEPNIVYRTLVNFMQIFLEQLAGSIAKLGHKNFKRF